MPIWSGSAHHAGLCSRQDTGFEWLDEMFLEAGPDPASPMITAYACISVQQPVNRL
jgi:hypothetical protein